MYGLMIIKFKSIFNKYFLRGFMQYLTAPLLFSIYPVLFFYTKNIQILHLEHLFEPLMFALLLAVFIFVIFAVLMRDLPSASIAASGFIIIFWHYGFIFKVFTHFSNLSLIYFYFLLISLYIMFLFFIVFFNKRLNLVDINKILTGGASVLVVFYLFMLIFVEVQKGGFKIDFTGGLDDRIDHYIEIMDDIKTADLPDIYLIIFDEYARFDTIYEEWGYDNSGFAGFLRERGFYIAEKSEKRYFLTVPNLASLLNLEYVTGPVPRASTLNFFYKLGLEEDIDFKPEPVPGSVMAAKIRHNFLISFLNEAGYRTMVFEGFSYYSPATRIAIADKNFSYQDFKDAEGIFDKNPFALELLHGTAMRIFSDYIHSPRGPKKDIHYEGARFIFDSLKSCVHDMESPKFVLAHVMCPHWPFVFDRYGNHTRPTGNSHYDYLEQYIFATEMMKQIVTVIQERSGNALILLQSDHGPRPDIFKLKNPFHAFRVLNAVYFPDEDYSDLYGDISTVNTLRVIFNKYFNRNYEMLDDR